MPSAPEICPNCGADVPPRAKACPECGASEDAGWSEDADADRVAASLGIPSENFDYDEFVKQEFAPEKKGTGLKWYWVATAIAIVIGFLWMFSGMFR